MTGHELAFVGGHIHVHIQLLFHLHILDGHFSRLSTICMTQAMVQEAHFLVVFPFFLSVKTTAVTVPETLKIHINFVF